MADFSIDLELLRAPSIRARGDSGLAQLRLSTSDGQLPRSGGGDRDGQDDRSVSAAAAGSGELVWVSLYLSTDGRLDSGDHLLVRRQVRLNPTRDNVLNLEFSTAGLAVAEGSYNLIARIEPPAGVVDTNQANNESVALVNGRGSDPILIWTSTALNAIKSAGSQGKPGVPPTLGTRLMAMLSTAMLDTVAAFGDRVSPYRLDLNAPKGASREAAIVGAAQRILSQELPGESDLIQAQLAQSLADIKGSKQAIQAGLAFGAGLADQVRASRANDGFDNTTPYTPPATVWPAMCGCRPPQGPPPAWPSAPTGDR
jgi:hypothetical protein